MTESPSSESQQTAGTPISSSLSAEAAEFVPSCVPLPNGLNKHVPKPNTVPSRLPSSNSGWKEKQRPPVSELPSFITSCYPFVQPNGSVRPPVNRFPAPYRLPGNVPFQGMPMPLPLPPSNWTQPSRLNPPTKVMVNRFSHPRPLSESFDNTDKMTSAALPTKGLMPNHPTVPMVPQGTPALMMNAHTHPDLMYPLMGGSDSQLPFFHPSQMSKPPPAHMPTPLGPLSHPVCPTRPPPPHHPHPISPLPTQHPQVRPLGMPPFTTMTVPPSLAFPNPSASIRSKTSSSSSSSISSSSTTLSQKKLTSTSTTFQGAQATRGKMQRDAAPPGGRSSKSSLPFQDQEEPARPASPIFISRSAQTEFPPNFRLLSLKDVPHRLFNEQKYGNQNQRPDDKERLDEDFRPTSKAQNDSCHNAGKKLSVGVQVSAAASDSQRDGVSSFQHGNHNLKSVNFWKEKTAHQGNTTGKSTELSRTTDILSASESKELFNSEAAKKSVPSEGRGNTPIKEDYDQKRKHGRKKHDKRDTRSPRRVGSSPFLSRSSSSISSAGLRDDDEKIDLHSWTDFPPMSAQTGTSTAITLAATSEGSHIYIQRSRDAPPWTLKHSSSQFEEGGKESPSSQQEKKDSGTSGFIEGDFETKSERRKAQKSHPLHDQSLTYSGKLQRSINESSQPPPHLSQGSKPSPQLPQPNLDQQTSHAPAPVKNYALAAQSSTTKTKPTNNSLTTQSHPHTSRAPSSSPSRSLKCKAPGDQSQPHRQRSHPRHNSPSQAMTGFPGGEESSVDPSKAVEGFDSSAVTQSLRPSRKGASPSSEKPNGNLKDKSSRDLSAENVRTSKKSDGEEISHEKQEDDGSQGRRRRRRVRSKKGKSPQGFRRSDLDGISGDESKGVERGISSSSVSEMTLHFEDVDEFPDLMSASRGLSQDAYPTVAGERSTLSGTSLSYSDIIKSSRPHSLTGSCVSGDNEEDVASSIAESKRARKRRKRREQANKAAETELAEISLEQRLLKEGLKKSVGAAPGIISDASIVKEAKKQGGGSGKKSKEPITFSIADVLDAMQKSPTTSLATPTSPASSRKSLQKPSKVAGGRMSINSLDSSGPVQKRGKEREVAKPKKPSPLKKVILKEREEKKRMRLLDGGKEDVMDSPGVGILGTESELSQDALSSKSEGTEGAEQLEGAELSADLSPISQTSPIPMSPASPGNSGVNSPVTGSGRDPVVMKIHSRRFREYCTQILDKEIDQCCTVLLQDLVRFQDRMYHKDPVKAKSKRRLVLGLREVTKHLRLKKIKCVVISPNLEKIQSKGGLDEALNKILNMCQEQNVPFVFALGRRALGRACAKLVPVSVVGIFNFDGCEDKYHTLISLTANARTAYHDMVAAVEREVAQHSSSMSWQAPSISGVPNLLPAHMGHSRTPSGCSAISFTSSIMSEPHSEFYPSYADEQRLSEVTHTSIGARGLNSANDIDDGNEADIEDFGESKKKRRVLRGNNSVRFGEGSSDDKAGSDAGGGPGLINSAGASGNSAPSSAMQPNGGNINNNNASNSNSSGTAGATSNGTMDVRPHLHHHNLHHHRRQSSVSSLARINEGVDDEVASKPCDVGNREDESSMGKTEDKSKSVVSHIDSIHSPLYKMESEILPSSVSGRASWEDEPDDNDAVDENVDDKEVEEDEEVEGNDGKCPRRGHLRQRSMDKKERIKNWLESQSHIPVED